MSYEGETHKFPHRALSLNKTISYEYWMHYHCFSWLVTARKELLKVRSHGAAAATVPLSIGFQPHSVQQRQWQSNIQCNAKYFATAAAAAASAHMNNSIRYNVIQLITAPLPQPLPHRVNGPLLYWVKDGFLTYNFGNVFP